MSFTQEIRQKSAKLWHIRRVKRMVRDHLGLGPHALIGVVELPCALLDCPGPVTQISILGLELTRRVILLHCPLADIGVAELSSAFMEGDGAFQDRHSNNIDYRR